MLGTAGVQKSPDVKGRTCGWLSFPGEAAPAHSGGPGERPAHPGADAAELPWSWLTRLPSPWKRLKFYL